MVDLIISKKGNKPREAADAIQQGAQNLFGGKYQAIVSDCDFGFADYYLSDCHVKTKTGTGQYVLAWKNAWIIFVLPILTLVVRFSYALKILHWFREYTENKRFCSWYFSLLHWCLIEFDAFVIICVIQIITV